MSFQVVGSLAATERRFKRECQKAVDATARSVKRNAQMAAPVDKGALRESAAIVSSLRDEQSEARAKAQAANPKAGLSENVTLETDANSESALVVFLALYAGFVHFGYHTTTGRYIAGRPFLQSALDAAQPGLEARAAKILDGMGSTSITVVR